MRWSALLLVPLFAVACDREPVAPSVGDGPVLGSASSEWTEWVVSAPTEGWSWGPVPCLPGNPEAVQFGSITLRFHYITTPGGDVREIVNSAFSDDTRLEIADETWTIKNYVRHGMNLYDPGGTQVGSKGTEANAMFENTITGAVLNWPFRWHFSFNANGDLTVAFVRIPFCHVTH